MENFNTSHVKVRLVAGIACDSVVAISIHLMLRFDKRIHNPFIAMVGISIHLMLRFDTKGESGDIAPAVIFQYISC